MYALPALVRGEKEFVYHHGSLISLPNELLSEDMLRFYELIIEEGWYKDPLGYYTFAHAVSNDSFVLFPGISLIDDPPPSELYVTLHLSKRSVERYVRQIFELELKLVSEASGDINLLVHDLRAISSSIYNSALEARMAVNRQNFDEARRLLENVICAQTILRIRTDILDYLNNPASVIDNSEIDLKGKTERVIEAFRPLASAKEVSIRLRGRVSGTLDGPDIFEFIPFVLLENAVKYCPTGDEILVVVEENAEGLRFSVTSVGPLIESMERVAIFGKGVRGVHAPVGLGSGVGLYVLKTVVRSHFSGRVYVRQEDHNLGVGGSPYFQTTFTVEMPYS